MIVTVVMQNDYPLEVLFGTEESNRCYIEELGHKINEENALMRGLEYDRENGWTKTVFVRGCQFEVKEAK